MKYFELKATLITLKMLCLCVCNIKQFEATVSTTSNLERKGVNGCVVS